MELDLPLIWALIIAFGVMMYVMLDGFDLGLGILFPLARDEDRGLMMTTVAPVWDGNETWLVLGGAMLFGAFPIAYAVLLPAFYIPLLVMLIALIFRGVAFEFRWKSQRNRRRWDFAFALGSIFATFSQGIVLGAYISGLTIEDRAFSGGPFDWLTPFNVLTGLALIAGYGLLGATWLIMKSDGPLEAWARKLSLPLLAIVIGAIAIVSIWTPLADAQIRARWFSLPNFVLLAPVPALVGVAALLIVRQVRSGASFSPFLLTLGLFFLSYLGLGISLWPNVIPPDYTIWDAAAPRSSQLFMLVGVAILLPVILAYTAYTYWVFRGKTQVHSGYH